MPADNPDSYASMVAGLEQAGMSRTEIARAANLSRNSIWRAATGMWREPDHQSVVKLERIYQRTLGLTASPFRRR